MFWFCSICAGKDMEDQKHGRKIMNIHVCKIMYKYSQNIPVTKQNTKVNENIKI